MGGDRSPIDHSVVQVQGPTVEVLVTVDLVFASRRIRFDSDIGGMPAAGPAHARRPFARRSPTGRPTAGAAFVPRSSRYLLTSDRYFGVPTGLHHEAVEHLHSRFDRGEFEVCGALDSRIPRRAVPRSSNRLNPTACGFTQRIKRPGAVALVGSPDGSFRRVDQAPFRVEALGRDAPSDRLTTRTLRVPSFARAGVRFVTQGASSAGKAKGIAASTIAREREADPPPAAADPGRVAGGGVRLGAGVSVGAQQMEPKARASAIPAQVQEPPAAAKRNRTRATRRRSRRARSSHRLPHWNVSEGW